MREFCANCGARINPQPVDGSEPDEVHGSWWEEYECENGCSGRLEWTRGRGTTFTGALVDGREVIV